jgi:Ca2+-binding EF-hand superfamily protein
MGVFRCCLFLFITGTLLLLATTQGQTQDRGGKGKKGKGDFNGGFDPSQFKMKGGGSGEGRGGGPGGGFDPAQIANRMFDRLSSGKDYIVIAELPDNPRDPDQRQRMMDFAQKKGITNGQLTREQFTELMQDQLQNLGGGRGGGQGGGQRAPDETTMRNAFRDLDKNSDNALSVEEMPGDLLDNLDRWDVNKDRKIQYDEYKEFFKLKFQAQQNRSTQSGTDEEKRPVIYDAKNLPPQLMQFAPWFSPNDTDRDGQVALYEWKTGGRNLVEFYAYDTNRDGFITIEEVLRYERKLRESPSALTGDVSGGLAGMGSLPGMGGPGGTGLFPGGPGGKGMFPGGPGGPGGKGKNGPGGRGGPGAWGGGDPAEYMQKMKQRGFPENGQGGSPKGRGRGKN